VALREEISPQVQNDFNSYMKSDKDTLLNVLRNRSSLHLGLYKGGSVEEWLESGW